MEKDSVSLKQIVDLARQLSPVDKVKLIEQVIPDLEDHLRIHAVHGHSLRSVYGLCADLGKAPSDEDIDAMRKEVFANFGDHSI